MSNKKYMIIMIGVAVAVFFIGLIAILLLVGNDNKLKEQVASQWPNLVEYDIPNLKLGKNIEIKNESNQDGYFLNYEIKIEGVKKDDLEKYYKDFSDNWTKSELNSKQIFSRTDSGYQYVVVVEYNEETEIANMYITSILQ